jgi:serine protease
MASPHVAGVAALLVSLGVTDPTEVRAILRRTAKPKAPTSQYGAGLLDAAAVQSVSQGRRQFSKRWGLAAVLSVLGLGVALGWRQELGQGASLLQFALPLAIGLCAPDALQFVFGFGSRLNMLGHSVLIPIVWLNLPNLKKPALRWALAVTVGLAIHLLMDAHSGVTPFAVLPPWRVSFWLYANAAVGAGLLFFAFQETEAGQKKVQKAAAAA